ncbi:hypothetical protein [Dokdonella sp.]|uniref:hypothetical protein n=1 Tax=Dokdonella sp. TaxID=2291710 RepID=UPI001B1092B9|nr:hypothetical protein [Dokdonella sp.]MBO9664232.1 hypothetical protein [Dokdonella sp.]
MKNLLTAALLAATSTSVPAASGPDGTSGIELRATLTPLSSADCGSATFQAHAGDEITLCYTVVNHSGRALDWHYLHDNWRGDAEFPQGLLNEPLADGASYEFRSSIGEVYQDADFSATWIAQDAPPPGYTFDDTVPFDFIDISGSPTATLLIDAAPGTHPVPTADVQTPFAFRFYEQLAADQLCIGLRGAIFVNQPHCLGWTGDDVNFGVLPMGGVHDMIALDFTLWNSSIDGGKVYVDTQGVAPNRRYIVQWQGVTRDGVSGPGLTFEAILDEATSAITYQYKSMAYDDGGDSSSDYGGMATSGIQRDYSFFTQYSAMEPNLTDGKAVRWTPAPAPYSASASADAHLRIVAAQIEAGPTTIQAGAAAGGSASASLTIGNSGNEPLDWTLGESLDRSGFSIARRYVVPSPGTSTARTPLRRAATVAHPRGTTGVPAYATRLGSAPSSDMVSLDLLAPQTLTHVNQSTHGAMVQVGGFVDNDFSREYLFSNAGCNPNTCWGFEFGALETRDGGGIWHVISSGDALQPSGEVEQLWQGMKWDASTRTLYAVASSWVAPTRTDLYSIDPKRGTSTWIARLDDVSDNGILLADIAIAPNGSMYGIDEWTDTLLAIDKSTGHVVPIGPTGLDTGLYDNQSIDFDPSTGVLYYASFPLTPTISGMYTLDLVSGHATLIGPIGDGTDALRAMSIAIPAGPCANPQDVPWISFDRTSGSTAVGGSDTVQLSFDASGLAEGAHRANVCVSNNTPFARTLAVPVVFTVTGGDGIFADGFEAKPAKN